MFLANGLSVGVRQVEQNPSIVLSAAVSASAGSLMTLKAANRPPSDLRANLSRRSVQFDPIDEIFAGSTMAKRV
jgi:hypothetical protein